MRNRFLVAWAGLLTVVMTGFAPGQTSRQASGQVASGPASRPSGGTTRPATGGAADVIRPTRREEQPANPSLPTLWLIGDSTVRNGQGDGSNGQWGWGSRLGEWFDASRINVVNRALGGTSSRTFMTMGRWDTVLADAKKGDWVMMQFGHNDDIALNDAQRARGTIKGIGEETEEIDNLVTHKHEVVHSYGWYMAKYVRDAKAKGMRPIVCSWIPRCPSMTSGGTPKAATPPTSYQLWAQEIAAREGAGYIDLRLLITKGYEGMTAEGVRDAYFAKDAKTGKVDTTHTSDGGARFNAEKVVAGVRGLDSELKTYLK